MERIFVSSLARGDMSAIRQAAREGVESLSMRPVMFETEPAAAEGSRRALLDKVATCDALILLLGAEYGEPGERGASPTEEEFIEARDRGIDVLALVQDIDDREPAQTEFIARVRGSWEAGGLTGRFTDDRDVGMKVVRALNDWRQSRQGADAAPAAQERALELARGSDRRGFGSGGSKLRVVAVPILSRPVLDAVTVGDPTLADNLAGAARASSLVSQAMGVQVETTADAIRLLASTGQGSEPLALSVGFDGAVVAEGAVGGDDQMLGSMKVMADRTREVISRAAAFAEHAWALVDRRDEIRRVLLVAAVPDAQQKTFVLEDPGNSMSMSMNMPDVVVAPGQPLEVRRQDLSADATLDRLQAELRRAFELNGAVHPSVGRR